jgi:hypothetical protein
MYTIIYECGGNEHRLPMVFGEKQLAMEHACELLRMGFRVLRIQGPGFSIGAAALHDYRRTTSARVHGQTLLRKQRRADRNGARDDWSGDNDDEMEAAGADHAMRKR